METANVVGATVRWVAVDDFVGEYRDGSECIEQPGRGKHRRIVTAALKRPKDTDHYAVGRRDGLEVKAVPARMPVVHGPL